LEKVGNNYELYFQRQRIAKHAARNITQSLLYLLEQLP
jgi:hypothetical protein